MAGGYYGALTDDMLQIVISELKRVDALEVISISKQCPKAVAEIVDAVVEEFNKDPDVDTLTAMAALCFAAGWKAREAVGQAEMLERMLR